MARVIKLKDIDMDLQEAFNISAAHLLKTRKPSYKVIDSGADIICLYSGSGCAIAPFIPNPTKIAELWEGRTVSSMNRKVLPPFIRRNIGFFVRLQDAHDSSVEYCHKTDNMESWLEMWKEKMREIAKSFKLDDSILNE